MRLEQFLNDLGSKKGAPGGGAAAALVGASGAALVEMVARLNDARLGRSSGTAAKAARLRKKLQRLIVEDARAFARLARTYRSRKTKKVAWQNALKQGAQPPLRVCECCHDTSRLSKNERGRTSAWLRSDLDESAILLRASFEAASLNVNVNLRAITDRAYRNAIQKRVGTWRRKFQRS